MKKYFVIEIIICALLLGACGFRSVASSQHIEEGSPNQEVGVEDIEDSEAYISEDDEKKSDKEEVADKAAEIFDKDEGEDESDVPTVNTDPEKSKGEDLELNFINADIDFETYFAPNSYADILGVEYVLDDPVPLSAMKYLADTDIGYEFQEYSPVLVGVVDAEKDGYPGCYAFIYELDNGDRVIYATNCISGVCRYDLLNGKLTEFNLGNPVPKP